MANAAKDEMTLLGLVGAAPFIAAAAVLWASPLIIPMHIALDFHQVALLTGGIAIAFAAGAQGGMYLAKNSKSSGVFIPGFLISVTALVAVLPPGIFFYSLDAVWRYVVILVLLVYLLMRDLAIVSQGGAPKWYGALRLRLTFWTGLAILLIASRLMLWGYF